MTFEISQLAAVETTDVHLRNPATDVLLYDGEAPMSITIYGPGSKPYVAAQSAAENRALSRFKRKAGSDQSAEEKQDNQVTFLCACTVALNNFDYKGGKDAAAIRLMYADLSVGWIAEQVNKALGDWSNFMQASGTN